MKKALYICAAIVLTALAVYFCCFHWANRETSGYQAVELMEHVSSEIDSVDMTKQTVWEDNAVVVEGVDYTIEQLQYALKHQFVVGEYMGQRVIAATKLGKGEGSFYMGEPFFMYIDVSNSTLYEVTIRYQDPDGDYITDIQEYYFCDVDGEPVLTILVC
jgi:hypothetical protein